MGSSFAIRGKHRTFQILFIKIESGQPTDVLSPSIEIFHYDDLDGTTGQNKIIDVVSTALTHDSSVGQYHFVWLVPINKPLQQVHYARYQGLDPDTSEPIQLEEQFIVTDDETAPPPRPCGGMTCSFVKW